MNDTLTFTEEEMTAILLNYWFSDAPASVEKARYALAQMFAAEVRHQRAKETCQ